MDPLLSWRNEFPILDTCIYLASHSLGAMPRGAAAGLRAYADAWNQRGVRAWSEGWWEIGVDTGDVLAPILGVPPGSISMHESVTVAQAIVASCHTFEGRRRKILLTDLEFPSNMYLYEGFRKYGADIVYVSGSDRLRLPTELLLDAIDEETLLVVVSLVLFKTAFVVDAQAIVEKAHRVGARVVLDVYQAAGTLPLNLDALGVDFVVGGSVKWLCGGPGAAYLYVRPDLARELQPALVGWAAHTEPFNFETGRIRYAPPPQRFQSGTPNVPALYAAREGYKIISAVGVDAIRSKSLRLTRCIMDRAAAKGYRINTPAADRERGGTVILDVPNGAVVAQELVRRKTIVDYRPAAGIRMAPHFYNTEGEIDRAMTMLDEIVDAG